MMPARFQLAHPNGWARQVDDPAAMFPGCPETWVTVVFDAIRELMAPPSKARRPIGFRR
jgi:hypothetical protein